MRGCEAMIRMEDVVARLSDADLKQAYYEILSLRETRKLENGMLTKIAEIFGKENDIRNKWLPTHNQREVILLEIVRRCYDKAINKST